MVFPLKPAMPDVCCQVIPRRKNNQSVLTQQIIQLLRHGYGDGNPENELRLQVVRLGDRR